jgi:hypothetical protein
MTIEFLSVALLAISIITGLTVEALKKILDHTKLKYSSNVLAIIVSVVISLLSSIVYVVIKSVPFSAILVMQVVILMFLSFLVSTLGYDKVIQTIKQFLSRKNNDDTSNNTENDK